MPLQLLFNTQQQETAHDKPLQLLTYTQQQDTTHGMSQ